MGVMLRCCSFALGVAAGLGVGGSSDQARSFEVRTLFKKQMAPILLCLMVGSIKTWISSSDDLGNTRWVDKNTRIGPFQFLQGLSTYLAITTNN